MSGYWPAEIDDITATHGFDLVSPVSYHWEGGQLLVGQTATISFTTEPLPIVDTVGLAFDQLGMYGTPNPFKGPGQPPAIGLTAATQHIPVNANRTSQSPWKKDAANNDLVGLPVVRDFNLAPKRDLGGWNGEGQPPAGGTVIADPDLKQMTATVTNGQPGGQIEVEVISASAYCSVIETCRRYSDRTLYGKHAFTLSASDLDHHYRPQPNRGRIYDTGPNLFADFYWANVNIWIWIMGCGFWRQWVQRVLSRLPTPMV